MVGEYIPKRLLPVFLRELCTEFGAELQSYSDDWVIQMKKDGQTQWVVGYTFGLNPASTDLLARDKVATYEALYTAGIAAVEHYLARSKIETSVDEVRFSNLEENNTYVVKPLLGSSGKGVSAHTSLSAAIAHINKSPEPEWALSPWYDLTNERRVILLDGTPLLSYEKTEPVTRRGVKFFNLSQGALPGITPPDDTELTLACTAAKACSLRLAAVDIVTDIHGVKRVMEINSGIFMEHFARLSEEHRNIALHVYRQIVMSLFAEQNKTYPSTCYTKHK